ncbi:MAG: 5-formyltetrahydrofolate cyclo-ligase [Proteobacteria bacterium]|nr:5-formyltetrahydrofolate cyclo-ligase [Pseudomonadota bacterium]
MNEASQEKDAIRKMMVEKRRALSPEEVKKASMAVTERVRALSEWKNAYSVLLYWPIKNEIDTRALLTELWERGAMALLPRCRPEQPGFMDICSCTCEDDLIEGSFNIMEPAPCCLTREDTGEPFVPDLVLVPAVAFDARGYRLGFGGGYYDRLMARPEMDDTVTLGLCYEFQRIESFPMNAWDAPVQGICTERELKWFR